MCPAILRGFQLQGRNIFCTKQTTEMILFLESQPNNANLVIISRNIFYQKYFPLETTLCQNKCNINHNYLVSNTDLFFPVTIQVHMIAIVDLTHFLLTIFTRWPTALMNILVSSIFL